jgi:hypothetical protein
MRLRPNWNGGMALFPNLNHQVGGVGCAIIATIFSSKGF